MQKQRQILNSQELSISLIVSTISIGKINYSKAERDGMDPSFCTASFLDMSSQTSKILILFFKMNSNHHYFKLKNKSAITWIVTIKEYRISKKESSKLKICYQNQKIKRYIKSHSNQSTHTIKRTTIRASSIESKPNLKDKFLR